MTRIRFQIDLTARKESHLDKQRTLDQHNTDTIIRQAPHVTHPELRRFQKMMMVVAQISTWVVLLRKYAIYSFAESHAKDVVDGDSKRQRYTSNVHMITAPAEPLDPEDVLCVGIRRGRHLHAGGGGAG